MQVFGVVDLVPSDVLASFLLAAAMQRADRGAALKTVLTGDETAEKAREADRETADITASVSLLLSFCVQCYADSLRSLQARECVYRSLNL